MERYSVRGFARWTLDVALSRIFNIGAHRLEFRAEAFNLPNAVVPLDPGQTAPFQSNAISIASPNFGRVTTAQDPRIMQFALKYVF